MLKAKACSVSHTSVEALKRSPWQERAKISQDTLHASVEDFRKRILRCLNHILYPFLLFLFSYVLIKY